MALTPTQIEQRRAAGRARAKQFSREFQQTARANVRRENLVLNGLKAQVTCAERYGPDAASDQLNQWRLDHPTQLEKIVRRWLDDLNAIYMRGQKLANGENGQGPLYADFVVSIGPVAGRRLGVVEADGEVWHSNNDLHGENRESRDRKRDARILTLGYELLRLPEVAIRNKSAKARLFTFLEIPQ